MKELNNPEILFEQIELLADPANPSHAYCSLCQTAQPIENFRRRPSPLLLEKWGWDKLLDKRNASHTFSNCNKCAKKQRLFPRCFDYDAYDRALKATGQYEFMVRTKDGEKMTQREYLVKQKREQRRQGKVMGGKKAQRTRYRDDYAVQVKQIRTEVAKVKYQRTKMEGLTPEGVLFLEAYAAHLVSLRENLQLHKQDSLKPKPNITDYINPLSLPTQQARQTHANLMGGERDRLSSKYL